MPELSLEDMKDARAGIQKKEEVPSDDQPAAAANDAKESTTEVAQDPLNPKATTVQISTTEEVKTQ